MEQATEAAISASWWVENFACGIVLVNVAAQYDGHLYIESKEWSNVTSGRHAYSMVDVCTRFPSKRQSRIGEIPTSPGNTKILIATRMQTRVIVPIECCLGVVGSHITYQVCYIIQFKGWVLDPAVEEPLVMAQPWFARFHSESTKWGGSHSPTFPTIFRDPLLTLSVMVLSMKSSKPLHDATFGKLALGGRSL